MTENGFTAWPAPAKLNLFLHVTGKREDGYHTLQTLFQILDWGDTVHIAVREQGVIRRVQADYDVAEVDDLAVRAASILQSETGCRQGADISVVKRIPMGSGMGGGSSDAATVLLVLNHQWGCGLKVDELAELGARLGADVPVFIHGHSAMAEGIGDIIQPVNLGERHYLLVFPGVSIATAEVFSDSSLARDSNKITLEEALAGRGRNDCEAVVRRRFPDLARMMDSLQKWGKPRMTGTGSGVFIPMKNQQQKKSAAQALKSLYNVRAVSGVDCSPLHEKLKSGGI